MADTFQVSGMFSLFEKGFGGFGSEDNVLS
jgi:hypothetical protein